MQPTCIQRLKGSSRRYKHLTVSCKMASNVLKFSVDMTCDSCSGAVERILNKHKDAGVESFQIDLPKKTVTVTTKLPSDKVLEILNKSGKNVKYLGIK